MTDLAKAVFLSYASQDAEAAERLCNALRAAGVEVWFDQSELRGGDAWDASIRRQIKICALFIPVISKNTHTRGEGYFRLEWKLAVDRSHLMASDLPFLMPVVIDDTPDEEERIPDKFREVQWTRLPEGASTDAFVDRVRRLLASEATTPTSSTGAASTRSMPKVSRSVAPWVVGGLLILTAGYLLAHKFLASKHALPAETPVTAPAQMEMVSDKSIAVLPFVDMSEKKDQEYFADGLSEELIDLLTKVPDLHVPARTSSFYFKGKPAQLPEIAKALHVANVLEGSVRKSGKALRITAHMIRVESGYDVWSQTYDRDVRDIFQIQDEIAAAVVQALKAQLLSGSAPTYRPANADAYSLFLQGKYLNSRASEQDLRRAASFLQRAVSLDPDYAFAWAALAQCYVNLAQYIDADPEHDLQAGRAAIMKTLALNPADAATHYLLATVKGVFEHDWDGAAAEIEAARRADPTLREPIELVLATGCGPGLCLDSYIRNISRDIERDPLNAFAFDTRGYAHYFAGELEAAESDMRRALDLSPDFLPAAGDLVLVLVDRHKPTEALTVVEAMPDSYYRRAGLALVYQALGRIDEANVALQNLIAKDSEDAPFQIAEILAFRGDIHSALDWLQRDYDLRRNGVVFAKTDPLLKPLAKEPRFIALMNKIGPR